MARQDYLWVVIGKEHRDIKRLGDTASLFFKKSDALKKIDKKLHKVLKVRVIPYV